MNNTPMMVSTLLLAALSAPAYAVNKCTGPDGKVTFQDTRCVGQGEAVQLKSVNTPTGGSSTTKATPDWKQQAAQADARLAIQSAIERHEAVRGMTLTQLDLAMGQPERVNTGDYAHGSRTQRVYERGPKTWYVYTDGGDIVTAVQTRASNKLPRKACPSALEIEKAETSASSITLSEAERAQRKKQIREMRQCGE